MKKRLAILLIFLCLFTGCSKEILFEKSDVITDEFHEITAAEKVDDGVLYYSGRKLLYKKGETTTELADNVTSLWREGQDIYYNSDDILYTYNFDTQITTKLVKSPKRILGKYDGKIISYSGRNIYTIEGTKKTKVFKDGYYLNNAVLYKNKVYGIPASNVYSYNLDTLETEKVTTWEHDMSYLFMANEQLYINTIQYSDERIENKCAYYKVTDKGVKKDFRLNDYCESGVGTIVKGGMFISTVMEDYDSNGNRLLYVSDRKIKTVDKNYYYDIIGIYDNKLMYYKNHSYFCSEQDNMQTFYLYDGKSSTKAFDLDMGYFEAVSGYEYDGGILIEVSYESSVDLYNYDGNTLTKINFDDYVFSIQSLAVIDDMLYMNYWDGEESTEMLGTVIPL